MPSALDRLTTAFSEPGSVNDLVPPETLSFVSSAPPLMSHAGLADTLAAARRDAGRIDSIIAKAEAEIAGIDARFQPKARAEADAEVRSAAVEAAQRILGELRPRLTATEAQRTLYTPEVIRRSARFAEDASTEAAKRSSAVLAAQSATAAGLQALAVLASSRGDLAAAVVIADELARRDDVQRGDRTAILRLLPAPPLAPELATLDEIREAVQAADRRVREFSRPGSTAAERLTAGFRQQRGAA